MSHPIETKGLLTAELEAQGFRLNTIFEEPKLTYLHIAWEPKCRLTKFHVRTAVFDRRGRQINDKGYWIPQREIGVPQVLANELHRMMPGSPAELLSESGINYLEASLRSARRTVLRI